MPITDQIPVNSYTGNGVATQYAYQFRIFEDADLVVTVNGLQQNLNTDYTVTGAGDAAGGNVVFAIAPTGDIVIIRELTYDRSADYVENGDLRAETLDNDFDRLIMLLQQNRATFLRAVKLPADVTVDQLINADAATRAGKILCFDGSGNITILSAADSLGDITTIGNGLELTSGTLAAIKAIRAVNSTATLTAADDIILANGTFTLNLPALVDVSTASRAKEYVVLNVGSGTVTLDGNGSETISGSATVNIAAEGAARVYGAGGSDWTQLSSNATTLNGYTASATPAAGKIPVADGSGLLDGWITPVASAVRDSFRGLTLQNNATHPTYQADLAATEAVLQNSSNIGKKVFSVAVTADLNVSGANGLDTGAKAANTWYHVWCIAKADGTTAGLLSTSATAPTMPADYSYKAYAGALRTDSGKNFRNMYQADSRVICDEQVALSAGTSTSLSSVNISSYVPSTAKVVHGTVSGPSYLHASLAASSSGMGGKTYNLYQVAVAQNGHYAATEYSMQMKTAQTIYYEVYTGGSLDMQVSGWEY